MRVIGMELRGMLQASCNQRKYFEDMIARWVEV